MQRISRSVKTVLAQSALLRTVVQRYRSRTRRCFKTLESSVQSPRAIEIGGPSALFSRSGPFPAYRLVERLDNVNFSDNTFWSRIEGGENFAYDAEKPLGTQFICDAIDLSQVGNGLYDLLLSSHCIEHIANPIAAIREWNRVLKPGGHMVLVAPDKRYTYDRLRPVTSLEHLREDFQKRVGEDDRTHFKEIMSLHDLSNDGTGVSYEQHVRRTMENFSNRMAHHHVFDLELLASIATESGLVPVSTDCFRPYHLLVIARKPIA